MDGERGIRLSVVDSLIGDGTDIAVGPYGQFGAPPDERDRITREATRAVVLATKASGRQQRLLKQLVAIVPQGELRFSHAARLQRFLVATSTLDTAAISDEELFALWNDAGRTADGDWAQSLE